AHADDSHTQFIGFRNEMLKYSRSCTDQIEICRGLFGDDTREQRLSRLGVERLRECLVHGLLLRTRDELPNPRWIVADKRGWNVQPDASGDGELGGLGIGQRV